MGFENYKGSIKMGAGMTPASEGYPLMQSCDIQVDEDGTRLDKKLATLAGITPVEKTLPGGTGILRTGVMYFLATPATVEFGLPTTAEVGDMVYVSFQSSDNVIPTLRITTDNHTEIDVTLKPDTVYEIMGIYNGSVWVMVTHEVDI